MKILVLNAGSSSQKSRVYEVCQPLPQNPPTPVWQAEISWEDDQADLRLRNHRGANLKERVPFKSRRSALDRMLETLWNGAAAVLSGPDEIAMVGHRVVHGGREYSEPTVLTDQVIAGIENLSAFAPLHNPAAVEGIQATRAKFPGVPQVGVFDTGFHHRLPEAAAVYPGPYDWLEQGIRRYGFHGINHQYCAERTAQLLSKELAGLKLVTCHLGNDCSLAAIRDGQSVETTMGFTPLDV